MHHSPVTLDTRKTGTTPPLCAAGCDGPPEDSDVDMDTGGAREACCCSSLARSEGDDMTTAPLPVDESTSLMCASAHAIMESVARSTFLKVLAYSQIKDKTYHVRGLDC